MLEGEAPASISTLKPKRKPNTYDPVSSVLTAPLGPGGADGPLSRFSQPGRGVAEGTPTPLGAWDGPSQPVPTCRFSCIL